MEKMITIAYTEYLELERKAKVADKAEAIISNMNVVEESGIDFTNHKVYELDEELVSELLGVKVAPWDRISVRRNQY